MRKSVLLLLSFLISFSAAMAQAHSLKQGKMALAHVPEQIRTAKTVFISNTGGGCDPYAPSAGRVVASIGSEQAYETFYGAMERWGRYRIAAAPGDAQLVFEVGVECPPAPGIAARFAWPEDPALRLVIRDMKSRAVLWAITVYVESSPYRRPFNKNWNKAMQALVSRLKALTLSSAPSASRGN